MDDPFEAALRAEPEKAEGVKAAAEPRRSDAIASFILNCIVVVGYNNTKDIKISLSRLKNRIMACVEAKMLHKIQLKIRGRCVEPWKINRIERVEKTSGSLMG